MGLATGSERDDDAAGLAADESGCLKFRASPVLPTHLARQERQTMSLGRTAPPNRSARKNITASTRNRKNRIRAASNDISATRPKPKNAAIRATTRNIIARRSMVYP